MIGIVEIAPTLEEVHAFLLGHGPLLGCWFGDDTRPPFHQAQAYWWRTYLRKAAAARTPDPIITEMVEALERDRKALDAMMDAWFDYHDSHSLTEPVTGAAGNAFDKALAARDAIDTLLPKVSGK